jgi:hypothetical protein
MDVLILTFSTNPDYVMCPPPTSVMDSQDIAEVLAFTDVLSDYLLALFTQKLHHHDHLLQHPAHPANVVPSLTDIVPPLSLPVGLVGECQHIAGCLVDAFQHPCQLPPLNKFIYTNP